MYPSVLIVDDQPSIIRTLSGLISDEGFDVLTALNGYEALQIVDKESPDLVLLDIWMPGIDGIETLKEIKRIEPLIQVIMITGHGTIDTAVKAIKLGAFSFIEKPLSFDKVVVSINNALNFRRIEEENKYLRKKIIEKNSLTGNSEATKKLKKQTAIVAQSNSRVLITGENGTGKELVARTIHQLSPRCDEPLIDVNCAAIYDSIIETELFGCEKEVFAEATAKKRGKFEMAGSGTLFLDEIGDMSLSIQAKILRVLQEKKFERAGGTRVLDFKARIISATNMNLRNKIKNKTFREDLYYRLNVIPLQVEPLRNRKEDIPYLIDVFFKKFSQKDKKKRMSKESLDLLYKYSWPGNVRELKNLLERLAIMVTEDIIEPKHLPNIYKGLPQKANYIKSEIFFIEKLKDARAYFEKEFIKRKLDINNGNIEKTASNIGVSRNWLRKNIEK